MKLEECCFKAQVRHNYNKPEVVQNAAARLITRTKEFDHITPVLAPLKRETRGVERARNCPCNERRREEGRIGKRTVCITPEG